MPQALRLSAPLAAIVLVTAGILAAVVSRITFWTTMTDELFYIKVARTVWAGHLLRPVVNGRRVDEFPYLYSVLLSPFYGLLDSQQAFTASHIFNAVLMTSTAVPAYLLARELVPRAWALAAAALCVALPWIALTALLMSEAVAYPVVMWTLLAWHRALVAPSFRRDLLALLTLCLACLARRQFAFLFAALPLTVLVYELTAAGGGSPPRRLLRALDRHRVLAAAYGAGIVALVYILGSPDRRTQLLGLYYDTNRVPLFARGMWEMAASQLDTVAIGLGVVPFVLGGAWICTRTLRAASERTRAFGVLAIVVGVLLLLESAAVSLTYPDGLTRDRYVFYLAPVLLIGAVACLREARPPWLAALAATAFFAGTVPWRSIPQGDYFWTDSAVQPLAGLISRYSPGPSFGVLASLYGLALGVLAAAALARFHGRALAIGAVALMFAFSASIAGLNLSRLVSLSAPDGGSMTTSRGTLNWIDRAVGSHASASTFPYPLGGAWWPAAVIWYDADFWNSTVQREYFTPGSVTYWLGPGGGDAKNDVISLDFATGVIPGTTSAPEYVMRTDADPRLALAGPVVATRNDLGLELPARLTLQRVARPYRAVWATRGIDLDGWTLAGRPVTVRLYGRGGGPARRVHITIPLISPPGAGSPSPYTLTGRGAAVRGNVPPQGGYVHVEATACVPGTGHTDLTLRVSPSDYLDGPPIGDWVNDNQRTVGALVYGIETRILPGRCTIG